MIEKQESLLHDIDGLRGQVESLSRERGERGAELDALTNEHHAAQAEINALSSRYAFNSREVVDRSRHDLPPFLFIQRISLVRQENDSLQAANLELATKSNDLQQQLCDSGQQIATLSREKRMKEDELQRTCAALDQCRELLEAEQNERAKVLPPLGVGSPVILLIP